jgi:acyl-coenzyme A synthetase/AMP-(fatty) acid ligase
MDEFRSSVIEMIRFWARMAPNRPAIAQSGMVVTYDALASAIWSIGRRLKNLDLDESEPVALALATPSSTLATAFALLELGYDVASVNRTLFPHLRSAGIQNLIYETQGQFLSGGRNIRFDRSWLPETIRSDVKISLERNSKPVSSLGNMIFFTSGTTGLPKKITQSASALDQLLRYPFTSASGTHEKILIMPSLASTFGFNRACEVLNAGKTAFFAPTGEDALSLIRTFDVELVIASPSQALSLTDLKKQHPAYEFNSLQTLLIGGGKIAAERVAEVRAILCRDCLSQYGSTECGVVALAPFETISTMPGAVGFILPWVTLEVVDDDGSILPPGSEGSIRYRTPQLMRNLADLGDAEMPGVRDQWFYPGDAGSVTSDGLLCLAGRITDVINRGGVKISSSKIEEVLEGLPEIKEAAACGVPGLSGLEELWVAVVSKSLPIDVERIKQWLLQHDEIKITPDEVFILEELPRGELGKVQKYRLREVMINIKNGE